MIRRAAAPALSAGDDFGREEGSCLLDNSSYGMYSMELDMRPTIIGDEGALQSIASVSFCQDNAHQMARSPGTRDSAPSMLRGKSSQSLEPKPSDPVMACSTSIPARWHPISKSRQRASRDQDIPLSCSSFNHGLPGIRGCARRSPSMT